MLMANIKIKCDATFFVDALREFGELLSVQDSELDVDGSGKFRNLIRKLAIESVLDFSNLAHIDSHPAAGRTGDVLLSLHPSDLFLELLAALRTGDCDGL